MSTVAIKIASVDYYADVVFASCSFDSAANGATGTCKFRVRDSAASLTFVTGASIELIIDGSPVWTGFLTKQSRVYAFPAENVSDAGLTRWLDIEGVDLGILFAKRIVFNASSPATILMPPLAPYPAHTPDVTAIAALVGTYLDLSGDGLDTSTYVENVADINDDQEARPFGGSDTFGQAMTAIATLPGAVYFIDPARNLVYTDVNTASSTYGLSDQPDGVTTVGYREMSVTLDGTSLANDVLAWGIGMGSQHPVFDRLTDATSLATHGRWQTGVLDSGVYKQATINRVADAIVNGSPSNQRGAKDDATAVSLVTYAPGFLPAQKVAFTSAVFGFSDVIPIRRLRVSFEAPDKPKYELTLSHAIDSPWGFFDQFLINLPTIVWHPPNFHWPIPCFPQVLDNWNRTVPVGWGDSSFGPAWAVSGATTGATIAHSVNGTTGIATTTLTANGTDTASPTEVMDPVVGALAGGEYELSVDFLIITTGLPSVLNFLRPFLLVDYPAVTVDFRLASAGAGNPVVSIFGNGTSAIVTLPATPATPPMADTQTWVLKIGVSRLANSLTGKAWLLGQAEPGWQVSIALSTTPLFDLGGGVQVQLTTEQSWTSGTSGTSAVVGYENLAVACIASSPPVAPIPFATACGVPGTLITEYPVRVSPVEVKTACSYQPDSLVVRRNGLLQRGDGINYSQTDSTAGLITFSSLLGTDTIEVRYTSQGNPST